MKFIICFAVVLAVAQAHVIAPAVTYAAAAIPATYSTSYVRSSPVAYASPAVAVVRTLPVSTYTAAVASPSDYSAPFAYSSPAVYSAPAFYSARASYSVPAVYSAVWRK